MIYSTLFQSTPPVRGETSQRTRKEEAGCNFNPLPPCGGRREEKLENVALWVFQSTPPVRGETEGG